MEAEESQIKAAEETGKTPGRIKIEIQASIAKISLEFFTTKETAKEDCNEIVEMVSELKEAIVEKLGPLTVLGTDKAKEKNDVDVNVGKKGLLEQVGEPIFNVAKSLGVDSAKLVGSSYFGFKNGIPQIFNSSKLQPNGATRVLIYLFERGLSLKEVPKEKLQEAFDLSHVKGRKLTQCLQDLIKTDMISKGEKISLTPKGDSAAMTELKTLLGI